MNILYLVKGPPDDTLRQILDVQRKDHRVSAVDLQTYRDYAKIVDLIASHDAVVAW